MNYRDIARQMERSGHYPEADELVDSVERNGYMYARVRDRYDASAGLDSCSYAAAMAERAYEDIRSRERREEERRYDERMDQERQERMYAKQQRQAWEEQQYQEAMQEEQYRQEREEEYRRAQEEEHRRQLEDSQLKTEDLPAEKKG